MYRYTCWIVINTGVVSKVVQLFWSWSFGTERTGKKGKAKAKATPNTKPNTKQYVYILFILCFQLLYKLFTTCTQNLFQTCLGWYQSLPNIIMMSLHRWISDSIKTIQKGPLLRIIELEWACLVKCSRWGMEPSSRVLCGQHWGSDAPRYSFS